LSFSADELEHVVVGRIEDEAEVAFLESDGMDDVTDADLKTNLVF
jgi:hypothetical protein